jgi:hypothetical protein
MLTYLGYIRSDLFLALVTAFSSAMLEYGNYSATIRWIEIYRQNLKLKKLFDTQTTLQVFQIIAHFKKGNLDLVENMLVALERFLKKNGADDFDKEMILAFKNLLKKNTLLNKPNSIFTDLTRAYEKNPAGKNRNLLPVLEQFFSEVN